MRPRPGRSERLGELAAVLDASGAPGMLEASMPQGGRHRQLSPRTVLLGLMVAIDSGHPAQLEQGHRALCELELRDQIALGFAVVEGDDVCLATYRQFEDTFTVMVRQIDSSPVPSFKGVADDDRAAHLHGFRAGIDATARKDDLSAVADALVEASVPARYKAASSSLAVDWTDHETWSRPRPLDDPQPANDPDASFGHAKRNAPGAKDFLFFGYYAQVATMVGDEGAGPVPELIRRIAFEAPVVDPAGEMASVVARAAKAGVVVSDVVGDCGYSNRDPATWARPLRAAGAGLVVDLHPADRGPKGDFEGAVLSGGCLYCPKTPVALLKLGPIRRGPSKDEASAHNARYAELARYRLSPLSAPDRDGYQRLICPAAAGKLRCPLKPSSLALSAENPTLTGPAPSDLPRCCSQKTITVPPQVSEKTRQKHPYPSKAWAASYARRTASERSFASLADPSTCGIRRGWSRLFGRTKNTIMYAIAVVVRNMRIVRSFERSAERAAKREAAGKAPLRRRRRYQPMPDKPVTGKRLDKPG